jgi:uncharacterized membrane protein YkvA (DUF1232 family)
MKAGAPRSGARSRGAHTKAATRSKAASRRAKAAGRGTKPVPLITEAELRRAVIELAASLAPADVGDLLAQVERLRGRAALLDGAPGELMRAQMELAIACLRDHAAGQCPQIPYATISELAAGLAYLADELDIIPDFLPHIGTLDDALVMAMACRLADDGLRRYCTWKGIDAVPVLGAGRKPAANATRRKERA